MVTSAVIYINDADNSGDLPADQLALLHKFSDQAHVWAYLLLKEAGLIGSSDEWHQKRQDWVAAKEELKAANSGYADTVNKVLQDAYTQQTDLTELSSAAADSVLFPDA